jgi:hypothetical protein
MAIYRQLHSMELTQAGSTMQAVTEPTTNPAYNRLVFRQPEEPVSFRERGLMWMLLGGNGRNSGIRS